MKLQLEHVGCLYGNDTEMPVKALDDVSLTLTSGQFVGLIGHTGSGKSTLVQHLNGLLRPAQGRVLYNGRDVWGKDFPRKELRSHVGLVFQYPEYQLFEADVFSDVCFGPKNLGLGKEETEERARQALNLVGLPEEFYGRSPFELSGGQRRRAAIAGVLAMGPELLILDEPTAGLDPAGRNEILGQISRLKEQAGIGVLLVSHSMEDVANYAERILVMDQGRILFDDPPAEVFRRVGDLEEIGLAVPQVTYILHRLSQDGWPVDVRVTTVVAAKETILAALGRKC